MIAARGSSPLGALDTCICMGASVGMAHGFDLAKRNNVVNVVETQPLFWEYRVINSVYNKGKSTIII